MSLSFVFMWRARAKRGKAWLSSACWHPYIQLWQTTCQPLLTEKNIEQPKNNKYIKWAWPRQECWNEWEATGKTKKNRIRNESTWGSLGVEPIGNKMRKSWLRWFCQVKQKPMRALVRSGMVQVESVERKRGRSKLTWVEVLRKNKSAHALMADVALERL